MNKVAIPEELKLENYERNQITSGNNEGGGLKWQVNYWAFSIFKKLRILLFILLKTMNLK